MVCQSLDQTGDLKGLSIYIKKIKGNEVSVILSNGIEAKTTIQAMNIDPKSIHSYDAHKDFKF